jgi:tetratricopeptide (TPR) repeat protein
MTSSQPRRRRTRRAPIRTVGLRIRKLRRARGLRPLDLAQPEFTKRYLRAVERCNIIPSLKVIELFAQRLEVPVPQLLRANVSQHMGSGLTSENDLGALQEDLNYQLNYAKMLIKDGKLEEALECIRQAEVYVTSAGPHAAKLPPRLLYRLPMLKGMAYVQGHNPDAALPELQRALSLVEADEEKAATVHNLLGVAYYLQERPELAIKEHLVCLRAVQNDVLRDLSSRFSVYRNLANDYWALGDARQALAIYKLALPLLQDLNDPIRKAAVFSAMGITYSELNDNVSAILWSSRARELYLEHMDTIDAAEEALNLAELLIKERRFDEVEPLLREASDTLSNPQNTPNELLLSQLNRMFAQLALNRGLLDKANEYIQVSLDFGEKVALRAVDLCARVNGSFEETDRKVQPGSACYPIRSYVETLHLSAKIAEMQGHVEVADEMFASAMEWARKTGSQETIHTITLGYGQAMEERGAHGHAMVYYKAAAQANLPLKRKHADRSGLVG